MTIPSLIWYSRTELTTGVLEFKIGRDCARINKQVYFFGGYSMGGGTHNYLESLHLESGCLTRTLLAAPLPSPRIHHSLVAIKNSLYVFGGEIMQNYSSDMWKIYPETNVMETHSTLHVLEPRKYHAACAFGNQFMLVSGGLNSSGVLLNDFYSFNAGSIS